LGCEIDGHRKEDAMFEVREKEVFAAGDTADKAARVFDVGKIATLRGLVLLPHGRGNAGEGGTPEIAEGDSESRL
jgi:hypothetical protein